MVSVKYRGRKHYLRLNSTDPLVWFSVFLQGDYAAALPFEPRVILDAGAYTGLSAIYFTEKYPAAQVIAVEPDPENFRLLMKNVGSHGRIHPVHAALWFEDAELTLRRRPEGHWASSVHSVEPGTGSAVVDQSIPALRIETLMSRFAVPEIDVLKVDIEGAEKEVFEHSAAWIDRVGAIFIETHDRFKAGCSEAVATATPAFRCEPTSPMTLLLINPSRESTGQSG